jgi:hypothetical protein
MMNESRESKNQDILPVYAGLKRRTKYDSS